MAEQLAADGTELVLVARDQARMEALAEAVAVDCEVLPADLGDLTDLERVETRIEAGGNGAIDLVVNNAGFGFTGPFHELDRDRESAVVDVNVLALHRLSHAAASTLVAQNRTGGILNVSSMAAWMPAPNSSTYAATKAFVNSFSESLHAELKPKGINVSVLCPGFTRTEFQERADYDASDVPDFLWQSAEDVAAAGLAGVAANTAVVVPGAQNRMGATLLNSLPGRVRRPLLSRVAGELSSSS